MTGVLERALPEVAHAMKHRRADLGDLDPMGALRFPVVDRLDPPCDQPERSMNGLLLITSPRSETFSWRFTP